MKERVCTEYGCDKKEAEKTLENYKQKKQHLEDAKYRKNEQAIPDLEAVVKRLDADLTALKAQAESRYRKCADCITARTEIQTIFTRVIDKMKSEPEKEIQSYISTLTSHFEDEGKKHNDHIDQVNNARSNCDWVRNMS